MVYERLRDNNFDWKRKREILGDMAIRMHLRSWTTTPFINRRDELRESADLAPGRTLRDAIICRRDKFRELHDSTEFVSFGLAEIVPPSVIVQEMPLTLIQSGDADRGVANFFNQLPRSYGAGVFAPAQDPGDNFGEAG